MRNALVLGAADGTGNIGEAVVKELRNWGWDGVDGDACQRVGGTPKYGNNIYYDAPPVEELGEYDDLVITLGTTYKEPFWEIDDDEVRRVLRACLELPLIAARRWVEAREPVAKATHPEHRSDAHSRLVLVGSYAHSHPFTNGTLYCAAKAGLAMAARTLAWELTDRGYRIHVVHPYHVNGTPMWSAVEKGVMDSKGMTWEEADAYNRKDLKMPDLLTAPEVARVIRILLNEYVMGWTSGTPIELFGGSR